MNRRRLSDDEHVLWKGVTRSIKPLKIAPLKAEPTPDPDEAEPLPKRLAPKPRARPVAAFVPPSPPPKPAVPPLAPLGRKTKQRIARGSRSIDGRLDLHGMTQAEAHDALFGFIRAKQARGGKLVLVITGKGARGGDDGGGRGVLKRVVPLWLGLPEFRGLVLGFESAAIGHGGEGALYVSLRKARAEG
jgi:DNA-nicking Smr family endonuclease